MPYKLISKIQKLNYPFFCYGPGNVSQLLQWGLHYYSILNTSINYEEQSTEFIIHFPYTPVFIHKVTIKVRPDVFPTKWALSVSSDNDTYTPIIDSEQPLCKYQYQNDDDPVRTLCTEYDENTIEADTTNQPHSSYFIKFKLIENTYHANNTINKIYQKLINFAGYELTGEFFIRFKHHSFSKIKLMKQILYFCFIFLIDHK